MADRDSNSSAAGAVNNKSEEAGVGNLAATQIESNGNYGSSKPTTFWGKFKVSLKRFWWAYLIFFLCSVVLAVMLLIFVGIKNIAQDKIDNATLEVLGISCTDTLEDTFTLGINTTLKSGTTKATVSKFKGVMYLEDEPSHRPFVTIDFPSVKNKRFQTVNISQNVQIVDKDALTTFNTWLLSNESLRVTVLGHPTVKVPGISKKYGVTFKKTVTLTGLNGFAGINAYNGSISLKNFTDGTNFHTTTEIPNASVVTFEIGNATFANFLNGSHVGTTYLDNVTLYPGKNVFSLRSSISQGPVLTAVQTQPYCGSGIVPFQLSGRGVDNNGQNLTYFGEALAAHNTTIDIDLDTPLKALGLNPKCPSS
ncbi:hypothetical protein F503_02788 [Ophiostoma piceae UAMH 11346]|uniref:Uncharacterized protein n=1 Tax=Ophiostoma piceae (strain UAMH 11346) TaxID=1262450 RepID=S3BXG8_OPHP1|nr:hypothetical protein F503_02788 [Ophiostoma piceae UAMH 11346]